MDFKPLVSICMACYNEEIYIAEAIQSVIEQTFEEWECIVVDDGSTDKTVDIIKAFGDQRIQVVCNKHDYIDSLNKGFEKAQGKYIARMDGDDHMLPDRLLIQYNYMEVNPQLAACGAGMYMGGDKSKYIPNCLEHDEIVKRMLLGNPFTIGFVRRSFLEKKQISYRKEYFHAEDYRLWADIVKAGGELNNLPIALYNYRASPKQKSQINYGPMMEESIQIRKDILNFLLENIVGSDYLKEHIEKEKRGMISGQYSDVDIFLKKVYELVKPEIITLKKEKI